MTQKQIDTILIGQKNQIIELINNRKFTEARSVLRVLADFWLMNDYKYKLLELRERITNESKSKN